MLKNILWLLLSNKIKKQILLENYMIKLCRENKPLINK